MLRLLCYKVAIFNVQLETGTSRARLVLLQFESWKPVLRVLDLHYKVAIPQLELEACTFLDLCYKLRFSSWSWKPVLRVLDLTNLQFYS